MRYFLRTLIGLGLMIACATLMAYALYQLLQIGTCASGGPYVSARQCPTGTERLALAFFPAVIGLIVGAGIYAFRGDPPGRGSDSRGGQVAGLSPRGLTPSGGRRVNAWILLWCLIFLGLSFASLWGVWGPDANPGPGGKTGGLIVGFLFAVMGLAAVPFLAPRRRSPAERQAAIERIAGRMTPSSWRPQVTPPVSGRPPAPSGFGAGDTVTKLERANRLRSDGAITEAEFQKLKAEILGGGG